MKRNNHLYRVLHPVYWSWLPLNEVFRICLCKSLVFPITCQRGNLDSWFRCRHLHCRKRKLQDLYSTPDACIGPYWTCIGLRYNLLKVTSDFVNMKHFWKEESISCRVNSIVFAWLIIYSTDTLLLLQRILSRGCYVTQSKKWFCSCQSSKKFQGGTENVLTYKIFTRVQTVHLRYRKTTSFSWWDKGFIFLLTCHITLGISHPLWMPEEVCLDLWSCNPSSYYPKLWKITFYLSS